MAQVGAVQLAGLRRQTAGLQGLEVVDEIRFTQTGPNPPFRSDVPIKTMLIKNVSVIDQLPKNVKTSEEVK